MNPRTKARTLLAAFYVLSICLALGLKLHYSRANSDQLRWILAPTTWIVSRASGMDFDYESGAGYLNRKICILISPGCAGVNFLTVAFLTGALSFLHIFRRHRARFGWMALCLAMAYVLTLLVNSARILIAIALYRGPFSPGSLTPESLHLMEGIGVYLTALLLWHWLLSRVITPGKRRLFIPILVPMGCYTTVVLGIPLLRAYISGRTLPLPMFSLVVLTACALVLAGAVLLQVMRGREDRRQAKGTGCKSPETLS